MNGEQTLVGSLIFKPEKLDEVRALVAPDDFTDPVAGALYHHLLTFWDLGIPVGDMKLLVNELFKSGFNKAKSEEAIPPLLAPFLNAAQSPASAKFHAKNIHADAQYRHLQRILADTLRHLEKQADPPEEIRHYLETRLCEIEDAGDDKPRPVGKVAMERVAELRESGGSKQGGIGSGCMVHDAEYGLWYPGELIVLAARPGVGKSKLAEQIAGYASDKGRAVLVISLEMKAGEWVDRMICSLADIDNRILRSGRSLDEHELSEFESAAHELQASLVDIWARSGATVGQIRAKARALKARAPLGLIVVDYLQRLKSDNPKLTSYERVSDISRQLKDMAQDLSVPVLALCQLNRTAEGSELSLDQLRDSGQIEQDADEVIMLARKPDESRTDMFVAKHRNAPSTTLELEFDGITGFSGFPLNEFERSNQG